MRKNPFPYMASFASLSLVAIVLGGSNLIYYRIVAASIINIGVMSILLYSSKERRT
jgi:hypothetical protein